MTRAPEGLPGTNLVNRGLDALREGERTVEALLVLVGAPRLRAAGLEVPGASGSGEFGPADAAQEAGEPPEIALYRAVAAKHPDDAHSKYNALVRRLVSFERALEGMAAHAALARPVRHDQPDAER